MLAKNDRFDYIYVEDLKQNYQGMFHYYSSHMQANTLCRVDQRYHASRHLPENQIPGNT